MMSSSSLSSSNEGGEFPDDVLFEIFLLLPADSLVRFQFVCKYWFNFITTNIRNPRFVQMHQQHHPPSNATITTTDNLPTILYIPAKPRHSIYSLNINALSSSSSKNKEATQIDIVYPLKSHTSGLEILGSCNGLLCIQVTDYESDQWRFTNTSNQRRKIAYPKDTICLWNPSTNEFKQVPPAGIITPGYGVFLYGFGYDRLINDYKLVRLAGCYYEVYTMGTNSWKRIDKEVPFLQKNPHQWMSVYVNGALHWLISRGSPICSLNIEDGEFGVVPQPEWSETVMWPVKLQVLRGCLCMFNGSNGRFELWMMMDYGVKESWTKLFRAIDPELMPWGYLNLLWICKNGEVIIQNETDHDQNLVIYDPNNNKVESFAYQGNPSMNTLVHIGSLVSLKSGTYVGQEQQLAGQANKKKKTETKKNTD